MKKTLIINIGNTIIHFEEDAFEMLTSYLNGIKAHFASTADNFEIVTDIENRIAEMLNELLAEQQKQVVDLNDVQGVMARMGSISDFENEGQQSDQPKAEQRSSYKRLFRDTEDMKIAGVCAGVAHYVNIDVSWVRLFALVCISFGGLGIIAYIVLWAVVPAAVTRADKMSMKGEAANLQGFKRNFDEELAAFRAQVKNANAQFEPFVKRTGNAFSEFFEGLGRLIEMTVKVFFKFVALMIIITGICFLLTLLISLAVVFGIWDSNLYDYFPFTIINNGDQESLLFAAFITCFVPVLALVLFSIRVAFNKNAINKTLSFALLTIWLCGVAFTAYYVTRISNEFKEHAELTQTSALKSYPEFTLNLDQSMNIDESMMYQNTKGSHYKLDIGDLNGRVIVYDEDHPFRAPRNVRIDIQKSDSKTTSLTRDYEANGRDFRTALKNAQMIDYKFVQANSTLTFNPILTLSSASSWRAQEVHLQLKVPVGTVLHIQNQLYPYLEYYRWNCERSSDEYTDWVMTEDGMKCKNELQPEEQQ